MLHAIVDWMVYLGAALMVYNICRFVRFAGKTRHHKAFERKSRILYVPVALLVFFLMGYLAVGLFGRPDLIVAGILLGGSIFVYIVYVLLDGITHRIIDSETLEKKLLVAEETSRAKNSFMASISHEMRTPMNVILGLDGLALRDPSLSPETRDQLERIRTSALHMLSLISNVLDMNSIDAGELRARHEEFSLAEVLREVGTMTENLCAQKGLQFEKDIPAEDTGRYLGDAVLLRQSLNSILDNAVKYTDAPGTVRLTLHSADRGDGMRTLRFTVSDTGVGISPEFLPRLFDPLAQEDSSFTNRFGGSGLGLAVTKNIVDLMGGEIAVESEKGKGSTFTVLLPLTFVAPPGALEQNAHRELESLEGCRVLVVEDIPDNAEIVQDLLEMEGVETDHAENGQVALDMFGESEPFHYDAVLMDLRMPVMDGLEATRRIRALDRPDAKLVPILALTANAFERDVRQSMEAGMNEHLAKPTDSDTLYAALKMHIAESRERRETL